MKIFVVFFIFMCDILNLLIVWLYVYVFILYELYVYVYVFCVEY